MAKASETIEYYLEHDYPNYMKDRGCQWFPSCLECGFDKCVHEMNYYELRALRELEDEKAATA